MRLEEVVSVVRSVRSSSLFALVTVVVLAMGTLVSANGASADSVWLQSYQRASQTEACTAQPGETPWQASWGPDSSWNRSWEQWPNGGTGGWTCTRSITWAKSGFPSGFPSAGCISTGAKWLNFGGSYFLNAGSVFYDANCINAMGTIFGSVYAPAPFDALTLCLSAFGRADNLQLDGGDVYICNF